MSHFALFSPLISWHPAVWSKPGGFLDLLYLAELNPHLKSLKSGHSVTQLMWWTRVSVSLLTTVVTPQQVKIYCEVRHTTHFEPNIRKWPPMNWSLGGHQPLLSGSSGRTEISSERHQIPHARFPTAAETIPALHWWGFSSFSWAFLSSCRFMLCPEKQLKLLFAFHTPWASNFHFTPKPCCSLGLCCPPLALISLRLSVQESKINSWTCNWISHSWH